MASDLGVTQSYLPVFQYYWSKSVAQCQVKPGYFQNAALAKSLLISSSGWFNPT